jgi:hypothetical protein
MMFVLVSKKTLKATGLSVISPEVCFNGDYKMLLTFWQCLLNSAFFSNSKFNASRYAYNDAVFYSIFPRMGKGFYKSVFETDNGFKAKFTTESEHSAMISAKSSETLPLLSTPGLLADNLSEVLSELWIDRDAFEYKFWLVSGAETKKLSNFSPLSFEEFFKKITGIDLKSRFESCNLSFFENHLFLIKQGDEEKDYKKAARFFEERREFKGIISLQDLKNFDRAGDEYRLFCNPSASKRCFRDWSLKSSSLYSDYDEEVYLADDFLNESFRDDIYYLNDPTAWPYHSDKMYFYEPSRVGGFDYENILLDDVMFVKPNRAFRGRRSKKRAYSGEFSKHRRSGNWKETTKVRKQWEAKHYLKQHPIEKMISRGYL